MTKRFNGPWAAADLLVAVVSMWLASSRRMRFLDAAFDDRLFAKLANSIRDGHWLGSYDNLTLAKGPGYPLFMALASGAGIPLRLAEQAVYLLGCWLVSGCIWRLSNRRVLGTIIFTIAALNPVLWGDSLARVVRENLYAGLTVLVLGLAMTVFISADQPQAGMKRLAAGALLGVSFGWFWLTREEGMWLVPALSVLAAGWIWQRRVWRSASVTPGYNKKTALILLMPCLTFAVVDLGVAAVNYRAYGVFETNDFRSDDFRAAYGALGRIEHEQWQRWIAVPRDARIKAYAVSPAMRELRPYLEGELGQQWLQWQKDGCAVFPGRPCDDLQSGWFMWALRDAVQDARHYTSASDAQRFYRALAHELNEACDTGRLACLPPRDGFLPPFRREYLPIIAQDAWQLADLLSHLGGEEPGSAPGVSMPEVVHEFRRVARGPWTEQNREEPIDRSAPWSMRIRGWVLASKLRMEVGAGRGAAPVDGLVVTDAPDVIRSLGLSAGAAVRFAGDVPCAGRVCPLSIDHDGVLSTLDLATLQPGSVPAQDGLRMWLDEIGPAQSGVEHPGAARAVTIGVSAVLRAAGAVLLPICVLAGVLLCALDLRARRLHATTVVWLALLAAISARIALLATLDATSLPAVSALYLSPAVGPALLYMAGIAGCGALVFMDAISDLRAVKVRASAGTGDRAGQPP